MKNDNQASIILYWYKLIIFRNNNTNYYFIVKFMYKKVSHEWIIWTEMIYGQSQQVNSFHDKFLGGVVLETQHNKSIWHASRELLVC